MSGRSDSSPSVSRRALLAGALSALGAAALAGPVEAASRTTPRRRATTTRPAPTTLPPPTGITVLPPGHDPATAYPVLAVFPPTGLSAQEFLESFYAPMDGVIILLAARRGSAADYATGAAWSATIASVDRQFRADLAALQQAHAVDAARVAVGGFSLGGDLAWAVATRNPTLVRGAVVFGSRASASPAAALPTFAARRTRLVFGTGSEDSRRASAAAVVAALQRGGADATFETYPGAHEPPPADLWGRAVRAAVGG